MVGVHAGGAFFRLPVRLPSLSELLPLFVGSSSGSALCRLQVQLPSLEYAEHHQVVTGVVAHHQVLARLVKVEMSREGSQT